MSVVKLVEKDEATGKESIRQLSQRIRHVEV